MWIGVQPYHDPRKAFMRVLTPRLLVDAHNALVADGLFVVQTDNPDYWDYMTRVLPSFFEFTEHHVPWPDAPEGRNACENPNSSGRGLRIFRGAAVRRHNEPRNRDIAGRITTDAGIP